MNVGKIKNLNLWTLVLIVIILLLAYLNSFKGVWFFDDTANIVTNTKLHITDLNIDTLINTLFAAPDKSGTLYRPLPCLTFALNWYIAQDSVFGYHVVNFAIHCLNTFVLFLAIRLLFRTPRLRKMNINAGTVYWVALFSALLWGLHPIQIQSVTYIVQRMASMAALFFLLGLYCYLKGCLALKKSDKIRNWAWCAVCYILALSCKANVAVLPGALLILYWVFFREGAWGRKERLWAGAVLILFLLGAIATILFFTLETSDRYYAIRYFTLPERLMTEFRIIYLYLYQIFWPMPSQFQVEHYISLSTALFSPPSTLFALLGIIGLLCFAIVKAARWPLVCFAILYFFCCHLVESTVVPLELIYEHRNYIPTMFMGVPIVFGFIRLLQFIKEKRPEMQRLMAFAGIVVLVLIGFSTFLRNYIWQDDAALYISVIEKYPQVSRGYVNLGYIQLKKGLDMDIKDLNVADAKNLPDLDPIMLEYMEIAMQNNYFHRLENVVTTYTAMPVIYRAYGLHDKALAMAKENVKNHSDSVEIQKTLPALLMENEMLDEGIDFYTELVQKFPEKYYYNMVLGALYQEKGDARNALNYLLKAINLPGAEKVSDEDYDILLRRIGTVYVMLDDYAKVRPGFEANLAKDSAERYMAALWLLGINRVQGYEDSDELLDILKEDTILFFNSAWETILKQKGLPPEFTTSLRDVLTDNILFNACISQTN